MVYRWVPGWWRCISVSARRRAACIPDVLPLDYHCRAHCSTTGGSRVRFRGKLCCYPSLQLSLSWRVVAVMSRTETNETRAHLKVGDVVELRRILIGYDDKSGRQKASCHEAQSRISHMPTVFLPHLGSIYRVFKLVAKQPNYDIRLDWIDFNFGQVTGGDERWDKSRWPKILMPHSVAMILVLSVCLLV